MNFKQELQAGKFVLTMEMEPPFGTDCTMFKEKALKLKGNIDAINDKEIHPCDEKIMAKLFSANTLLRKDEYCKDYLKAKKDGRLECVSS
jgi:hypothetical protein